MMNIPKIGYVQDVRYTGYAGAITGDVKWREGELMADRTLSPAYSLKANFYP